MWINGLFVFYCFSYYLVVVGFDGKFVDCVMFVLKINVNICDVFIFFIIFGKLYSFSFLRVVKSFIGKNVILVKI